MRKRRYAEGGEIGQPGEVYPSEPPPGMPGPAPMPGPVAPSIPVGGSGGTAREGLGAINQGANTVGNALDQISGSLKGAAESIGGGLGGLGDMGGKGGGTSPSNPMDMYWNKMAGMKKGGKVKSYAKGGTVSSASKRGDGIAQRGKTKGRMC